MLPDATEFVTAGRFVLETDRAGVSVGRFVYGRSYLERPDAVAIDPLELKLGKSSYSTAALGGVFGALRDAGPDYWGRRVIEKHSGKPQLGELDYLLYAPDDRAGALGFGLGREPPAPKREFNRTLQLEKLLALADAIIADGKAAEGMEAGQVEDLSAGRHLHGRRAPKGSGRGRRRAVDREIYTGRRQVESCQNRARDARACPRLRHPDGGQQGGERRRARRAAGQAF